MPSRSPAAAISIPRFTGSHRFRNIHWFSQAHKPGKINFGAGVKNCRLFEELATSSCNLAATKIAPRNPHEAKNLTFYDAIDVRSIIIEIKNDVMILENR